MSPRLFAAALASSLAVSAAFAQSGPVKVESAWARATPPRAEVGAIYMTLTAPTADRLVGVSTPAAAKAEVHDMTTENGVMRMREVAGGLSLPAGQPVVLGPGGYHVMLKGLQAPLKPGQQIPLHLTFASAPPLDVTATVRGLGGAAH
jgi:periplasmic copper chaperone A